MAIIIHRFDRFDNPLGVLNDILSAEWTESLDGTDEIELTIGSEVSKGDRLVWRDVLGSWHEHIVYFTERTHSDTKKFRVLAENSISELYGDYILDKRPTGASASVALTNILTGAATERSNNTRWGVGTVTVSGTNSTTFYRQSVRECLADILDIWGGELSTTITVSGSKVTSRAINITHRGSDNGRWFEYGHNIAGITRTYSDEGVVTALYGFGKGEAVGDGYGRRIDFSHQASQTRGDISFTSGRMYVENDTAKATWGRPDRYGVKQHVYSKVEFDDIVNEAELLTATMDELDKLCEPKISYEADVIDFVKAGYEIAGSQIGDTIRIIDTVQGFEARATGRVVKTVRDMLNESSLVKLTIGNVTENLTDYISDYEQKLRKVNDRSSAWDAGAYTTTDYLKQVMSRFNEEFESGGVYKYESFTDTLNDGNPVGVIYSSVPLNSSYKPVRTPAKAIQIRGGAFRISNKVDTSGNFEWTTAADGAGIIADTIVAGVIRDATGNGSYWNLESGDLFLKGTIESSAGDIGGFTIISDALYYGKESLYSHETGVYLGTDGISTGKLWDQGTYAGIVLYEDHIRLYSQDRREASIYLNNPRDPNDNSLSISSEKGIFLDACDWIELTTPDGINLETGGVLKIQADDGIKIVNAPYGTYDTYTGSVRINNGTQKMSFVKGLLVGVSDV